jgi:integrase/recombinase XerD
MTPAPHHSPITHQPLLKLELGDRSYLWAQAFNLWLDSRPAPNTRRAYSKAWQLLIDFTLKSPWELGRADLALWVEHLRARGLSPETIQQRLAAISSFFTYVTKTFTFVDPSGREQSLHHFNPALAVPRPKVNPYDKAGYLTPEQARLFLRTISRNTLQGLRDYALFLSYLATGRRNTEIRTLQYKNFEQSASQVWYRWQGKGRRRRDQCPNPVWQSIQAYLDASGRLPTILPDDYIFIALNQNALHLPNVNTLPALPTQPISMSMVGRLAKKYARRVGLDPSAITVHTLRHTAAMLRKHAGEDIGQISLFLGHSSLSVTQIYLHKVEGRPDTAWLKVEALLGLPSSQQDQP